VVWEEDVDFWDVLPLDWASEGAFGEEALAIRDAMEEEFQHDKMISRQKSEGKRELLNLHSSINYGDIKSSARFFPLYFGFGCISGLRFWGCFHVFWMGFFL
jgi:hypothetical protein